ncbi:conserved hypothetical protein [Gammaproteobacteria bacterium]
MKESPKILAIQFKYYGDAVMLTPALRAIHSHFPESELHVLVPEEVAPIFEHLPWLHHVWPMPRQRGHIRISQSWPVIRALRHEGFDQSVDFAGNDRGAMLSLLIGAQQRLGLINPGGFLGRRFCYHQHAVPTALAQHESLRLAHILSAWKIAPPSSLTPEIVIDSAEDAFAERLLPTGSVICHIASSQPKKEWPVRQWATFYTLAVAAGQQLVFTTAKGTREQALMDELRRVAPQALILPVIPELRQFLALLKRAEVFISGDTGPLHFAAGLGIPTISLFGPTAAARWAPQGNQHRFLTGTNCSCDGNVSICQNERHCLAEITPEQVLTCLQTVRG